MFFFFHVCWSQSPLQTDASLYMCISWGERARFKKAFGKTEADEIGNTCGGRGSRHTSNIREGQKGAIIGVWRQMKGRLSSSDHASPERQTEGHPDTSVQQETRRCRWRWVLTQNSPSSFTSPAGVCCGLGMGWRTKELKIRENKM